jgi:hypothetical protein
LFTSSPRAFSRIIERTSDLLEAEPPRAFTNAIARADKLASDAEQIVGAAGPLNAEIITSLRAGKDWTANPAVLGHVLSSVAAAAGIRDAAAEAAAGDVREAIGTYSDSILETWATAVAEDAEILARTGPILHDITDLAEADAAGLRAGGRLSPWGEALGAAERFEIAAGGARAVIACLNYPIERSHLALVNGPATLDQLDEAHSSGRPVDAWTMVRAGVAPAFITSIGDLTERVAAIHDEQQQRAREDENNRQEAGFAAVRLR